MFGPAPTGRKPPILTAVSISCRSCAVSFSRHGVNGEAVKKTVTEFNPRVANGAALGLPIPKTKLAQRIDQAPFYAIKDSPVNESPLGLFNVEEDGDILEQPEIGRQRRVGLEGGRHVVHHPVDGRLSRDDDRGNEGQDDVPGSTAAVRGVGVLTRHATTCIRSTFAP